MKRIFKFIFFELMGWKVDVTIPERKRSIICVAPHTSNWDFMVGIIFKFATGLKSYFLMKQDWFFWPLGVLLKRMGGIPIDRTTHQHLTDYLAQVVCSYDTMHLAITPEGTRSLNTHWKKGFYFVALKAGIPIQLFTIDYLHKTIACHKEIVPSGNVEEDYRMISSYYAPLKAAAKYPDKFGVDESL